jgi:hypothetical protein
MPLSVLIVCASALSALAITLLAVGRIRPEVFKIDTTVTRWFSIHMEVRISNDTRAHKRKSHENN